ncbi:MFS transporter [Streptomyces sp. NPDC002825]|uniref:MFS transporter n=1 Tax=Streptomyces sp. NPDC002825 TaxID=3154666 RepID=UPI00332AF059
MSVISKIRSLPFAARLLLLSDGISSIGIGMVFPFLWVYLTEIRHFDTWVPATALATQAGAAVVGGLTYGAVLSRMPYNRVVPLANVNAGVGTLLYAFAANPVIALVAACIFGFGVSGVAATVRAAYAATTEADQRETAYSADFSVTNLCMGIGVVTGGLIAALDFGTPVLRYGILYTIDALSFFVMAAITLRALPTNQVDAASSESTQKVGYVSILRRTDVLLVLGALLLASLVTFGQFRGGLPGYLIQTDAVEANGLSVAVTVNIVVCVVIPLFCMAWFSKVPRNLLLAVSGLCAGGCWGFVYLAGEHTGIQALALACSGVALLSVSESLVGPLLSALVNNLVTSEMRGRTNALFSITMSTSAVIGPVIAGALLPVGDGTGFIVSMLLLSAAAAIVALFLPKVPDAEEKADTDGSDASSSDENEKGAVGTA